MVISFLDSFAENSNDNIIVDINSLRDMLICTQYYD